MKNFFRCILSLLLFIPLITADFSSCALPTREKSSGFATTERISDTVCSEDSSDGSGKYIPLNYDNMKAMWLSQYDMYQIYRDGNFQRDKADFTLRINKVMRNISSLGVNTVIVQLRPNADSMYISELFPMSEYVVGSYGKIPQYDPFEILLAAAHSEGLSVHAWINPLRCMSESKMSLTGANYTISRWYNDPYLCGKYIIPVSGTLYLNPAYKEVRQLIIDGICEIAGKYDIDGVHIDDYFYPTVSESFDHEAYASYTESGGTLPLDEYRREQINTLIRGIYSAVKETDKGLIFGISPGGNMDTNYNILYADVYKWCSEIGYTDYICPQVYFGFEHSYFPFDDVCNTFSEMIKCDNIRLIIGITLDKAYKGADGTEDVWAGDGKREWIEHRDIVAKSIAFTKTLEKCSGVSLFSYQHFFDPLTGAQVDKTYDEVSAFLPLFRNTVWC